MPNQEERTGITTLCEVIIEKSYRSTLNLNLRGRLRKSGEKKSTSRNGRACPVQEIRLQVYRKNVSRFNMEKAKKENNRNSGRIHSALNRKHESKVKKTHKLWWEEHWSLRLSSCLRW